MKKTFLFSFLFIAAICAHAQRNVDLSITVSSPDSTTVITGTETFSTDAILTNNGPDTIRTTDTLIMQFFLDGNPTPENLESNGTVAGNAVAGVLSIDFAPGTSQPLSFPAGFSSFPGAGIHNLCIVANAMNRSADSLHETTPANNVSCTDFTFADPTGIPTLSGNNDKVTIYPNPATDFVNISLKLTSAKNIIVMLTDMYGRQVYRKDEGSLDKNASVSIDTNSLPAGTYFYNIMADGFVDCGKLSIVH
jgi:hypothetical protein